MLPEPLVAPADTPRVSPAASNNECREAAARINAALVAARNELTAASTLNTAASSPRLKMALRELARELVVHPRTNRREPWVSDVLALIKSAHAVGTHDLPAKSEDLMAARDGIERGWAGILACMIQVGGWEVLDVPTLDRVPDWLWSDYTRWLFSRAPRFTSSRTDPLVLIRHLRDLENWLSRNVGSSTTRAAVSSYFQAEEAMAGYGSPLTWRHQAELRGRILTRLHPYDPADHGPELDPRHGRRLRVAFVARNFGPSPELFATLPYFENLDATAFEILLLSLETSDSLEAAYCYRRASLNQVLPAGTEARLARLRESRFDIVVFIGDLGGETDELTQIALQRVAPLQVACDRTGFTTGLPTIDLYLSTTEPSKETASGAFTERLGILRGPELSFSFGRDANRNSSSGLLRADLGLPVESPLLVACVDAGGPPSTTLDAWSRLLGLNPEVHLAIAFLHEGESHRVSRLCSAFGRELDRQRVDRSRVHVFPASPERPEEVRGLIALSDVYLDSNAGRMAIWTAAEALSAGVPTIAMEAEGNTATATILRSLGRSEWVATDATGYVQLASALVRQPERWTALREQLASEIEAVPPFLDSLAASDAFGALLETAFDELASLGRVEFRQQLEVVRCFAVDNLVGAIDAGFAAHAQGDLDIAASQATLALRSAPGDARARHLQGVVLYAKGNLMRAIEYLLAAVQRPGATAEMWYSLALALRDNGQSGEAVQALETCIQIDHRHVEALLTILELAERVGATELARDVLESLQQVAPDDHRVLAMS